MGRTPDIAEIKQRAIRSARAIREDLKNPPWAAPGHFYSPVASQSDVARARSVRRIPVGVDFDFDGQRTLAAELQLSIPPHGRWQSENDMFGAADASVLSALLLRYRPKRFVEVGSGHSTALALDVADRDLPDLQITCVEPYADRLRAQLRPGDAARLTLIETGVQEIEPEDLAALVSPGDFFFIDSTHVLKVGSDVGHLFLHTLPLLPVGVFVHVHDVFWPFEYPDDWLEDGRQWSEIYLLNAFLAHNRDWRVVLFNDWLWSDSPELVPPNTVGNVPGSIWLERVS